MPSHTSRVRDFRLPRPGEIWEARGSVNHALLNAATSVGSVPLSPSMRRQYDELCTAILSADSARSEKILRDGELRSSREVETLRNRPVIVERFQRAKGSWGGPVSGTVQAYLLTTYDGSPIAQLPELAQHFSVSVGDTEPWPTPDATVIKPLPDWPKSRKTPVYVIAHRIEIPLTCFVSLWACAYSRAEVPYRVDPDQMLLLAELADAKDSAYSGKGLDEVLSWHDSWDENAAKLQAARSQVSAAQQSSARTGKTGKKSRTSKAGNAGKTHTRTVSGPVQLGANGPASNPTMDARPGNTLAQSADGGLRAPERPLPVTALPPPVVASPPRGVPPQRRSLTIAPPPAALPHVQPHAPPSSPGYYNSGRQAQWNAPGMPTYTMPPGPQQYPHQVQHVVPQSYGVHPAHSQAYAPTIYQHPSQPVPVMHDPGVYPHLVPAPASPITPGHFQQYQHQHQQYHNGPTSPLAHSTFPETHYAYAGHAQDAYDPGHNQYQYQQQQQQYQHQQHAMHEADPGQAFAAHAAYMPQQAAAYYPAEGHNQYHQPQPQPQPQQYYPGGQASAADGSYAQPGYNVHAPEYVPVAAG